jgi:hypothetical protein
MVKSSHATPQLYNQKSLERSDRVKLNCRHVGSGILSGFQYATLLCGLAYAAGDCNQCDEDSV